MRECKLQLIKEGYMKEHIAHHQKVTQRKTPEIEPQLEASLSLTCYMYVYM